MLKRTPNPRPGPWDEQIETIENVGYSPQQARDIVIMRWLKDRDLRPFNAFLIAGHVPSQAILLQLLEMVRTKRSRGRQSQRAKHWVRDLHLAAAVMIRNSMSISVEEAIEQVADASGVDELAGTGKVKSSMVKRAYRRFAKFPRRIVK
jgi:hypothetical protein